MSVAHYDLDNTSVVDGLLKRTFVGGAIPRRTVYGKSPVLKPFAEAYPDKLIPEADYKEVIAACHEKQIFPIYHQHGSWCPVGKRWNQDGLPYCWAWGVTAALMDCRAVEGKEPVLLSPVSLGWTVNWASRGNYLESAIAGAKERGVCSMEFTPDPHSRAYRKYKEGWEENALQNRIAEAWDLDNSNTKAMIQHSISVLATGTPIYIAYNWWGHALECCGVRWDESKKHNVVWLIRNSHDEDDVIELSGNRGVFDEAFGIRASLTRV